MYEKQIRNRNLATRGPPDNGPRWGLTGISKSSTNGAKTATDTLTRQLSDTVSSPEQYIVIVQLVDKVGCMALACCSGCHRTPPFGIHSDSFSFNLDRFPPFFGFIRSFHCKSVFGWNTTTISQWQPHGSGVYHWVCFVLQFTMISGCLEVPGSKK